MGKALVLAAFLFAATVAFGTDLGDPPSVCERILWFLAFDSPPVVQNPNQRFLDGIKAAVHSARKHAPSIVPVAVIYGEPNEVSEWLEAHSVIVIFHDFHRLKAHFQKAKEKNEYMQYEFDRDIGYFLRLEIPFLFEHALSVSHQQHALQQRISANVLLYTDVDVIFQNDIDTCVMPGIPELFAIGPEFQVQNKDNTGVMYINVAGYLRVFEDFMNYAVQHNFNFPVYDQGLVLQYLRNKSICVSTLPDVFNWKAYWGYNDDARIVHFHGMKLFDDCLRCCLQVSDKPADAMVLCNCPQRYHHIWDSVQRVDGGQYFKHLLQEFDTFVEQH